MRGKLAEWIGTISAFGLVICLIGSLIVIGFKLIAPPGALALDGQEYRCSTVVVQAGDTLWAIATRQAPEQDPRLVIDVIRELNGLDSAQIFPGQILTLPIQGAAQAVQLAGVRLE